MSLTSWSLTQARSFTGWSWKNSYFFPCRRWQVYPEMNEIELQVLHLSSIFIVLGEALAILLFTILYYFN